jgi:hypothetical protein
MVQTLAQYQASLKNLKHARAAKKRMSKGGFALPGFDRLMDVHKSLQGLKPVTQARDFGKSLGLNLPKGKFGNVLGKIGNFAIDKLGYGRRRKSRRRRRSSGGKKAVILRIM